MMGLTKLTKETKPLTRVEKLQLIEAISKMLLEEESPENIWILPSPIRYLHL